MDRIELFVMPMFRSCMEEEEQVNKLINQKRARKKHLLEKLKEIEACAFLWEGEGSSLRRQGWSSRPNAAERGGRLGMGCVLLIWPHGGCW